MNIDPRGVLIQILRWFVFVLLLSLAWETMVAAQGAPPPAQPAGQPAPVKAPPGPVDDFNRGVPRTSVEGYIKALRESDFERAAEYLDLRNLPEGLSASDGPLLAGSLGSSSIELSGSTPTF